MSDSIVNMSAFVTLLTPLGQGGLAVVRVFGLDSGEVVRAIFRPARANASLQSDRLTYGHASDAVSGEQLDECICHPLPGGLGYELSLHGGVRIVQRVVAACQQLGARRLDFADPSDRKTLWKQARDLHAARGHEHPGLAADIELALPAARTLESANWLMAQGTLLPECLRGIGGANEGPARVRRLLDEYALWTRALGGVRVAIVGPPNVGKSTLLNALCGVQAAIVSETPGTTRDYVGRWVNIEGLAVELIDTAGLREQAGELESAAVRLAKPVVQSADLILELRDAAGPPDVDFQRRLDALLSGKSTRVLSILNKCDLVEGLPAGTGDSTLRISARNGVGLDLLRTHIRESLGFPALAPAKAGLFTSRQADLLRLVDTPARAMSAVAALLSGQPIDV